MKKTIYTKLIALTMLILAQSACADVDINDIWAACEGAYDHSLQVAHCFNNLKGLYGL